MAADGSGEISKKICVACKTEYSHGEQTCPHDGTALTPIQLDGLIGHLLGGRYEIEEKIGGGAMGEVYKAKHRLMKRQVAIKMMHPQTISGASALKRFQKEAEMASALNHPNILTVHDFGVSDDGSPYLVMNFLEGKSLTDLIENNGHLPVDRALHIFRQLCQGLGHAHEKGVIHRDLKPSNIMLVTLDQDPDFVQILDFGIAKQLTSETASDSLTRTGEVFGSPHYMSPEQCRAQPVDARSDIYALGCVMYRVLTGRPPLMGGDLVECLYKHVNEMPAPFSEVCPEYNLPEDLEAVVFKALAKKPEDRYQNMAELKTALESVDAYQREIATKTYGSLAGIKPSAALTSVNLPPAAVLNINVTGTDIQAADNEATTASRAAGDEVAKKPSQTGDLPAMNQIAEGNASGSISASEEDASTAASHTQIKATPTGVPGPNERTADAPSPVARGQLVTGPYIKIPRNSPKLIIIAVVVIGLIAVTVLLGMMAPQGNAKIEKLQKQAMDAYNKGKYGEAEQMIRSAVNEERIKGLPENENSPFLLGMIQYAEGDYNNAKSSLESALRIKTTKHGAASKETAEVQSSLGKDLTALGQYNQAETVLQASYQTRRKIDGDSSPLVADSLAGLGYLHMREHSYQKAISELTSALRMIQDDKGGDSPEVATALCNLGQAYQLADNSPQAEALYKQALAIRKKKLDADSPLIADSYESLGSLYIHNNNLVQAKDCFQQALAIESKSLDSASPRLAQTRKQLESLTSRLSGKRHR